MAGAWRVAGFLMLVSCGSSYVVVRSAYAETEEKLLRFGEDVTAELGPDVVGEPQPLSINGEQLFVSSKQTELSVPEVLDRLADSCAARARGARAPSPLQPAPGDRWLLDLDEKVQRAEKPQALPALLDSLLHQPERLGILRDERAGAGQLACIAAPHGSGGLSGFLTRVREFVSSGDLAAIGDARYVAARRLENGKTHVLTIWSEGTFRIGALFPESGDAPGSDLPDVPRPIAATRELCVIAPGRSFALRLYGSTQPPQEVLAFYARALPEQGWDPLPTRLPDGRLDNGAAMRAFTREGRAVAIGTSSTADGTTVVSLADLGAVRRSVGTAGDHAF
jgi:hypothetical protein